MNKILLLVRILLFHLIIVLFYSAVKLTDFQGLAELIFVLILIFYEIIFLKDMISKSEINMNKKYNFLSILVFLMMIIVLLRCLGDSHFIYYDKSFVKELSGYETTIYGGNNDRSTQFIELIGYYLINNVVYFNVMFVLLFIYRKINLGIKHK